MEDAISFLIPFFAVLAVIAGAYLTTRWIATRQGAHSSGHYIKVIDRVVLAKDTYIVLMRVGNKTYLTSVGVGRADVIAVIDEDELQPIERVPNDFFSVLSQRMGKQRQRALHSAEDREQDGLKQ